MIEKYKSAGGERGRKIQWGGDDGEKTRRRRHRRVILNTGRQGREGRGGLEVLSPASREGRPFQERETQTLPILVPFFCHYRES